MSNPVEIKEDRTRFFNRLVSLSRASQMQIQLAYTLAKFSHRAQLRKELDEAGKPVRYFEHPRRVALILIDELKILDTDMIVAALLHDGIEDTRDISHEMIEHTFGEEVARIVALLSKVPKEGYLDRLRSFGDWKVFVLKACDRLDNLRSMDDATSEFRTKQIKETRQVYYPIFNEMVAKAPAEWRTATIQLQAEILSTTEALDHS